MHACVQCVGSLEIGRTGYNRVTDTHWKRGPSLLPPPASPSSAQAVFHTPWLLLPPLTLSLQGPKQSHDCLSSRSSHSLLLPFQGLTHAFPNKTLPLPPSPPPRSLQGPKQSAKVDIRGLAMKTMTSIIERPPAPTPAGVTAPPSPHIHHSRSSSLALSNHQPSYTHLPDLPLLLPMSSDGMGSVPPTPLGSQGVGGVGGVGPGATAAGFSSSRRLLGPALISPVLEPCDVSLNFKDEPDLLDATLDVPSRVTLHLAPDQLQLLLALQGTIMQPLVVPPVDRPLRHCERYTCLWSSRTDPPSGGAVAAPLGRVSEPGTVEEEAEAGPLDLMVGMRGVAIWAPEAPTGYVKLGDVLCTSGEKPTQQVGRVVWGWDVGARVEGQ